MLLVNLKGEISVQYQELEIKILDINREEIVNKLNEIGAEFVQNRIQKVLCQIVLVDNKFDK